MHQAYSPTCPIASLAPHPDRYHSLFDVFDEIISQKKKGMNGWKGSNCNKIENPKFEKGLENKGCGEIKDENRSDWWETEERTKLGEAYIAERSRERLCCDRSTELNVPEMMVVVMVLLGTGFGCACWVFQCNCFGSN